MPWWAKWALSLLVAVALLSIGWRYSFVLVTLHVMVCFVLVDRDHAAERQRG